MGAEKEIPSIIEQANEVAHNYYSDNEYLMNFNSEQLCLLTTVISKKDSFKLEHGYSTSEEKRAYNSMHTKFNEANTLNSNSSQVLVPIELTKFQIYLIDEALDDDSWDNPERKEDNAEIVGSLHAQMDVQDESDELK